MGIVQKYRHPHGDEILRYDVGRHLLVGGRILDVADMQSLITNHNVTAILNVSTETDDREFSPLVRNKPRGLKMAVFGEPDDGKPRDVHGLFFALDLVSRWFDDDGNLRVYVHCDKGMCRSPAYAYLLLRGVWSYTREQALHAIRSSCHRSLEFASEAAPRTRAYVEGIELFLDSWRRN